jgi:hypothetical protein
LFGFHVVTTTCDEGGKGLKISVIENDCIISSLIYGCLDFCKKSFKFCPTLAAAFKSYVNLVLKIMT